MSRRLVTILQPYVPHYREAFFRGLRHQLELQSVDLQLIHGVARGTQGARQDDITVDWAKKADAKRLGVGRRRFEVLQSGDLGGNDLLILEQALRNGRMWIDLVKS